jgi:hypothetical protein
MASQIDPTKPVDGVPASKADLRGNLQSAKDEIEALQSGKANLGHQHLLGEIIDAGALASKNTIASIDLNDGAVTSAKIADAAVTESKIGPDAVGAAQLQDGIPISMQGALLSGAKLIDYAETSATPAISAGALTLDLDTGSVFEVVLTQNVTSLILANAPAAGSAGSATLILRQDATGGRTLAWPNSVLWAGGTPPLVTPAPHAVDMYAFMSRDGGTTWYGFPGGQDFS